ncbi:hypothetical protein EV182_000314 [Spiromyces aspiralis]|uniref:Uncharacterized protein n=1 Tax=Spiromyces aspiralis TaxID=68401 RepID=A0ACC1HKY5_9FUNG|nr:hypothetical protein EV182_000314 [Spiromyces aspiralis]
MGLEWVGSNAPVEDVTESGSDSCWLVRRGTEQLEWYQFNWHKLGWLISGLCALVATVLALVLIGLHIRHYNVPTEQRYVIRIILLIPIYSIVSWLSYRFYREAPYIEAARDLYEAFVIAFFMLLILNYLGFERGEHTKKLEEYYNRGAANSTKYDEAEAAAAAKEAELDEKMMDTDAAAVSNSSVPHKWVFPFNFLVLNPTSERTIFFIVLGILQYCVIKPILTVVIIVTHKYGVYCPESMSPKYANVWVMVINFTSVTVAMYYLVQLYMILKEPIKDRRPLMKFLSIKLVIFFSFFVGVVLTFLGSNNFHVIHDSRLWTKDNVIDGLNALFICAEMVIFSIFYFWAFSYKEYKHAPMDKYYPSRRQLWKDAFNIFDVYKLTKAYSKVMSRRIRNRVRPRPEDSENPYAPIIEKT